MMRKAVLVSLDAFFHADTLQLNPDGFLAGMMREGAFCRRVETIFPALTYPIHVTMITGCDPNKSGVGQNQPPQPNVPRDRRVWYWERKFIRVPTLFDAVQDNGGHSCSVLWPVSCRNPAVRRCFPEVHPLKGENALLKTLRYGSPLFCLMEEKRFGRLRKGIAEPWLSDYAAAIGADTIRRHCPDLTAIHLIDLDDARHHHGTFSREATDAISRDERRLSELHRAMLETPGMEDALLIVVSDHGHEDIRETINLTEHLTRLGLNGDIFVQSNGMSAYFFPAHESVKNPGRLIRTLEAHREELGISHLYTREELDKMHAIPEPLFAAEAAEGIVFSDALDENKREAATHGFGPGREADLCLFAVYGKGIRKGYEIPSMQMRDIGPTIAGLMGLSLPEAQGNDLSGDLLT